jgi:hypothetical protein
MLPSSSSTPRRRDAIVWACVARDSIVLAESCPRKDELEPEEARAALKILLAKEPSLGWDSASSPSVLTAPTASSSFSSSSALSAARDNSTVSGLPEYKGLRFPVYEVDEEKADRVRVWTYSCVYNPVVVTKRRAQAFLEKMVMITEFFRESVDWRKGGDHSCQDEFGQIIQQRMEEMADPKLAVADEALELSSQIVNTNRVVMNAVRLRETSKCLDESSSSRSSKRENQDPTIPEESRSRSYLGFFKSLVTSKPLQQQQQQQVIPAEDAQQQTSLGFVEKSAVQPSESLEQQNEHPSLHRSRTDSMEDFLQALEREACLPQKKSGDDEATNADKGRAANGTHEPSPETASPGASSNRRTGSSSSRADTMAILVVMMLSCLLATLPRSILELKLVHLPLGEPGDSPV